MVDVQHIGADHQRGHALHTGGLGLGDAAALLTEVYSAGEAPLVAADGRSLARAVRVAGKTEPVFVEAVADLPQAILDAAQDGDVVICMGAGSIGNVAAQVAALGASAKDTT